MRNLHCRGGTSSTTPRGFDTGQRSNPPQHLLKEIDLLSRLGKFLPARTMAFIVKNIVRIKAWIHAMEILKNLRIIRPAPNQQDERKGDLSNDQNAAGAMSRLKSASVRPSPCFHSAWLTSPRLKRRAGRTPASIPVATEIGGRKGEHLRIQAHFQEVRKLVRKEGQDQADASVRPKSGPNAPPSKRQDYRLSKDLPEHASRTSAQPPFELQFLFWRLKRPRQREIGHIDAGDEKETNATAPSRTSNAGRTSLTRSSCKGTTTAPHPLSSSGYCCSSRLEIVFISA